MPDDSTAPMHPPNEPNVYQNQTKGTDTGPGLLFAVIAVVVLIGVILLFTSLGTSTTPDPKLLQENTAPVSKLQTPPYTPPAGEPPAPNTTAPPTGQ
jgi:hypothetical protein